MGLTILIAFFLLIQEIINNKPSYIKESKNCF